MVFKILLGLVMMAAGALFTIKSEAIYNNFGPIAWFEQHLGTEGGSRLGYKLIGIVVFFFGLLMATGLINGFLLWIFGPLIRATGGQGV